MKRRSQKSAPQAQWPSPKSAPVLVSWGPPRERTVGNVNPKTLKLQYRCKRSARRSLPARVNAEAARVNGGTFLRSLFHARSRMTSWQSKAAMSALPPESRHCQATVGCPLWANMRHASYFDSTLTCCSTTTGSVNANVEPWPGCDSTQILPPCISMSASIWRAPSRYHPSSW